MHSANAPLPIDVTLVDKMTDVKLLQPSNAEVPIEVTLLGIVKFDNPIQPLNASFPIDVTLDGIVTFVILVQYSNAFHGIVVPPVITTVFNRLLSHITRLKSVTAKGNVMLVKLLQL